MIVTDGANYITVTIVDQRLSGELSVVLKLTDSANAVVLFPEASAEPASTEGVVIIPQTVTMWGAGSPEISVRDVVPTWEARYYEVVECQTGSRGDGLVPVAAHNLEPTKFTDADGAEGWTVALEFTQLQAGQHFFSHDRFVKRIIGLVRGSGFRPHRVELPMSTQIKSSPSEWGYLGMNPSNG